MEELPQANRAYLGLLQLVPGVLPPGGQLSGGTNNPSKGMSFAFNGSNGTAQTVRIEGINGLNPWNRGYQSYVPSVEAIQNVNIATNANDAEQGIAGGASVNVMLKSRMRLTGATCTTSTPPLGPTTSRTRRGYRPPHLVDNNRGLLHTYIQTTVLLWRLRRDSITRRIRRFPSPIMRQLAIEAPAPHLRSPYGET
jgi:hypothetical protein